MRKAVTQATPGRLHLVEHATELRITEDCNGSPCGTAAIIGSTALLFRPRRSGSRRGEKMRYETFTEEDRSRAKLLAAAPQLLAALEDIVTNASSDDPDMWGNASAAIALARGETT